jgi:hypothetical protein
LLADTAEQFWQDWVMSYDFDRQVALFSHMQETSRGFRLPRFEEITAGLKHAGQAGMRLRAPLGISAAVLLLALVLFPRALRCWQRRRNVRRFERGETNSSDATLLYQQLLTALEKRGLKRQVWVTPLEFAHTLPQSRIAELVETATGAYNELRFGGRPDAASRMMRVLDEIEKL